MPTSKIKLLIFFTALTLIAGCVPVLATPTPIPPLDPNAINIVIAQTADAAFLQTQAAVPTFTPMPTATSTPPNTFTPLPTVTPIQTWVLPSPRPIVSAQYFRARHDDQLGMYHFKSRTFDENSGITHPQTPETVPLYVLPKLTSGTLRTTITGKWERFMDALNNYDQGDLIYLKDADTALFNTAGFPQMQSLTMGGNIITLDKVEGDWGRVRTLDYSSPPDAQTVNYITRPDLIHKFVIVGWDKKTKTTYHAYPPKGDLYWPLVTKQPVWVQMDRLESFPILPLVVTAKKELYIQTEPGPNLEETRFKVKEGETVKIIQYYPSGSSVWGRTQSGGWIPLLWYSGGAARYNTTWWMETLPPPPPQQN